MSKNFVLINGRHLFDDVDIDGYVFDYIPQDKMFNKYWYYYQIERFFKEYKIAYLEHINIYVTGLTYALIEFLKYADSHGIMISLYHYDKEKNCYIRQGYTEFDEYEDKIVIDF